jgi:hypothetical protein
MTGVAGGRGLGAPMLLLLGAVARVAFESFRSFCGVMEAGVGGILMYITVGREL